MRNFTHYIIAAILSVSCLVAACDKDGEQGPQGQPGPQGPAGPAGPEGPAGPNGLGFLASDWLEVEFAPDTIVAGLYRAALPDSVLTPEFIVNNEVRVYVNLGTLESPVIAPLPNEVGALYIRNVVVPGSIQITSNFDASTYGDSAQRKNRYKYIMISSDFVGRANNVNMNNYAEVQRAYRLKD
jgi:hypothetical protein